MLGRLLRLIGKLHEVDTYESKYDGHWVRKGREHHEEWKWIEKTKDKKYKINVFQLENDFIITVGHAVRPNAIETIECRDDRELAIALDLLESYYGTLGNVVRDTASQ